MLILEVCASFCQINLETWRGLTRRRVTNGRVAAVRHGLRPGGGQDLNERLEKLMADVANRYPVNGPGKFYVDNQCIDCDLCRETAPNNFTRSDDGGYSYVFKQPETPEEEAQCREAMEGCPVEAIGNNDDTVAAPA